MAQSMRMDESALPTLFASLPTHCLPSAKVPTTPDVDFAKLRVLLGDAWHSALVINSQKVAGDDDRAAVAGHASESRLIVREPSDSRLAAGTPQPALAWGGRGPEGDSSDIGWARGERSPWQQGNWGS